jgi:hypothetical protein
MGLIFGQQGQERANRLAHLAREARLLRWEGMQTKAEDEITETVTTTEAVHNPAQSAGGLPFLARNAPQRQKREVWGVHGEKCAGGNNRR